MESTGKVLIEEVYATSDELSIPLSSLKAGYYLVELKQGETTNIKGFIKQ